MANPDPPDDRREDPALAADQAAPYVIPEPGQAPGSGPGTVSGQVRKRHGPPPDPGCYEIRFGLAALTGAEAIFPAFGVLMIAMGVFAPESGPARVLVLALGVISTVPYLILLARRAVVFRADHVGITLGPQVSALQFSTEFTPWADIEEITFYTRTVWLTYPSRNQAGTYLGVVLRDRGEGRGQADASARRINTWRLDRARLAAIAAVAAPGIAITERERV